MPCANRSDERGSASLEFLALGLLLLVPLVYLILVLGQLQAAALAADGAARQAARSWVQQTNIGAADAHAARSIAVSAADFGITGDRIAWDRSCLGDCLTASSRVRVDVRIDVPLPLAPPVLGLDRLARITMTGSATQTVSRFGGAQ